MAKALKDILQQAHDRIKGVHASTTSAGSTGKEAGVDYKPKARAEQDFIAKHSVEKWDEPDGNPNYADKVKEAPYKKQSKGVYESKKAEYTKCNHTPGQTWCPIHEMADCSSVKNIKEAMTPKQKQHANRVKTMPGKKGNVMAKSNFEAPTHKVHVIISKNGGEKETVKHEVQAKDRHDAMFNVQMMHHKSGHKVHDTKYKGTVKEEAEDKQYIKTVSPTGAVDHKEVHSSKAYNALNSFKKRGFKATIVSGKTASVKESEDVKCNHTPKGKMCPVHGMLECWSAKPIKEVSKVKAIKALNQLRTLEDALVIHRTVRAPELNEVLTKSTTAGETIHDFVHSKNHKFAGKSKEKRKQMALAAYYAKQNEEVKEDLAMPLLRSVHGSSDIAKYKTDDTGAEIDMVRTELKAIANKTMHMLSNMPADKHIEPWVQAKIAAAKEMIGAVHDYMVYSDHEENETTDTPMQMPSNPSYSAPDFSADVNSGVNV